jgi:hypothetical protein
MEGNRVEIKWKLQEKARKNPGSEFSQKRLLPAIGWWESTDVDITQWKWEELKAQRPPPHSLSTSQILSEYDTYCWLVF